MSLLFVNNLPDHRVYYTCIQQENKNYCQRGVVHIQRSTAFLENNARKFIIPTYKHVCVFASKDIDAHFSAVYPGHSVVESLESVLPKTKKAENSFPQRWF